MSTPPPPPPQASRPAPPAVPPVSLGGIRYEQVMNGLQAGLGTLTGNLSAIDEKSGERLWTLTIYTRQLVPGLETDVQEVYFRSMKAEGDDALVITNERGDSFRVDLRGRSVTKLN